jgi:hypothetical protein
MSRKEPQPLAEVYVTREDGKNGSVIQKGRNPPVVTVVKKPAAPSPPPPPKAKSS